jgi:hypothetical protein
MVEITCSEFSQTKEFLLEIEIQCFRNRLIYFLFENSQRGGDVSPAESLLADEMREWLAQHPKSRRGNTSNDKFSDRVEGLLLDLTGQIHEVNFPPPLLSSIFSETYLFSGSHKI